MRQQHATELAQDYVEAIYELLQEGHPIKVRSLQEIFGVSHVTVIRTLKRLEQKELVIRDATRGIDLTPKGETIAREALKRHELLKAFFVSLGVSPQQADADAEGAEHHLSSETIRAIKAFLEKRDS